MEAQDWTGSHKTTPEKYNFIYIEHHKELIEK